MAERTRSGADLIEDAYDRSDNLGAVDRHPRANVLRYANQGGAELWDLLIEARGPDYFRATPQQITTLADTTSYTLDPEFYMLISVRRDGVGGESLTNFTSAEEPFLRDTSTTADGYPTSYQLRRTAAGVNSIAVLPVHAAGLTIVVDYVPVYIDFTDSALSLFHGVSGWEEYIVNYAAQQMATKDEEWALADRLDKELAKLRQRILKLAPKRDMHRAKRVKDVRGPRLMARRYW